MAGIYPRAPTGGPAPAPVFAPAPVVVAQPIPPIPPANTDSTSVSQPDKWVVNLGELARPFSVVAVGAGVFWACVMRDAAAIGAGGAVLGALYTAKTYENSVQAKASASVAMAQEVSK